MHQRFLPALQRLLAQRTPFQERAANMKHAGVFVLLDERQDDTYVILNRRSALLSRHQGEIAFPGGGLETTDADLLACAYRETHEEMGVLPDDVMLLGALDPVPTRTQYQVFPFVGAIPHPYIFRADPREVDEILEVPVRHLLDGTCVRHEARMQADGHILRQCSYAVGSDLVFGATALILTQLLGLIRVATGQTHVAEVPA